MIIGNTLVREYRYCHCQYFLLQVLILVLAIILTSIANNPGYNGPTASDFSKLLYINHMINEDNRNNKRKHDMLEHDLSEVGAKQRKILESIFENVPNVSK